MKIINNCLLVVLAATIFVGCAAPDIPGTENFALGGGDIGTSNHSFNGSQVISSVPGNNVIVSSEDGKVGPLVGESSKWYILGISFGAGHGNVAEAARKGGIQQVTTVERGSSGIFPFFWKRHTVVTGDSKITPGTKFRPPVQGTSTPALPTPATP